MKTGMVRANQRTVDALRRLRDGTGESTAELLDKAVELLERDRFLDAANQAFARTQDDPAARRAEADERALWEGTLADGQSDEG